MRVSGWACVGAVVMLAGAAACQKQPEDDHFAKGETLYLDQHYDQAIQQFKQFLLGHPNDAGGHFYLGTCYLNSKDNSWLGIAQGELETALALFERQGKVNPVPRFSSAAYFELISHINLAKVDLRLMVSVLDNPPKFPGFNLREAVGLILQKCEAQYDIIKKIQPDHPDVIWLRKQLDELRGALGIPPRGANEPEAPSPPKPESGKEPPSVATI